MWASKLQGIVRTISIVPPIYAKEADVVNIICICLQNFANPSGEFGKVLLGWIGKHQCCAADSN
jgi:hypothetical protein